ncbi:unnamed protein product, partial [Penicillium salamii]
SQTPHHVVMQCPHYTQLRKQLWGKITEIEGLETDYDKIVSHPQATRYVARFMHHTGLLQQFRHVGLEEDDDDERTGQRAMDAGVEDDG